MIKHLALLGVLFISINVFGQSINSISDNSIHDLVINQWTSSDGLVTNKIIDLKQSYDGYLWLTTYDGILRFDGISFELFDVKNTPAMEQNTYYKITEASDSTLWFISRGAGLIKYKNGEFHKHETVDDLSKNIRSIFIDSSDRLWIASKDNLYCQINDELKKIILAASDSPDIVAMAEDKEGNLYFGTNHNGIIKYDGDSSFILPHEDEEVSESITSMTSTSGGYILAGTFSGAMIIHDDVVMKIPFLEGTRVNDMLTDQDGNILFGTDLGLYRMNLPKNIYEKLLEGQKLPAREINSIDIDHEGSVWLGMEKGGVIQLKMGKAKSMTTNDGLSLNRTNIITQKGDNEYWVGSDNGDVDIVNIDKNTVKPLKTKANLKNRGIQDILFEGDNSWIASYNGLLKLTGGREKNYTEKDGLSSRLIRKVIKDKKGNLIIATRSGGVNIMAPNGVITVYDTKAGLKSDYILSLLEVGADIYAGTNRGGVAIIHENGDIETLDDYGDQISEVVNFNLRSDRNDRIWVATSSGLFFINDNKINKVILESSLIAQAFFDIIHDNLGNYWLSTSTGVVQLLEKDVTAFINGEAPYVNYKIYTDKDGLPTSECTAASEMLFGSHNKLWVPTNNGVAIIDPSNIKLNKIKPPTYITKLIVDNEKMDLFSNNILHIPPGKIRYTIGFTALSYIAPENVSFEYKLEGFDKSWNTAQGIQREIEYTNISPGTYAFRVKAANNDGFSNEEEATLTFIIEPFIYQTVWFYLVLVIVFTLSFFLIYKWRVNNITKTNTELKKLNNELDSFVYSTSHDLRAPLASILGLLGVAKLENDFSKLNQYLSMIESSVVKLDDFISDIINYSRNSRLEVEIEDFNIKELTEEILADLQYLDPQNHIKKEVILEGNKIIKADIQRIRIVLNNLISNSLKYFDEDKPSRSLTIFLNQSKEDISIVVEDNGIGIAQDQIDQIFNMFHRATETSKGSGIGLYIVQETVTKLNGSISVSSTFWMGTRFEVSIPK
jgi:signal transduction histidine kinase/ligand-binding sensor domain-containing protein